jgi:hypothetical protein
MRPLVYAALALLFLLHTDFWLWNDGRLILGLPVGLGYHLLWTAAVVGVLWLAVRHAWPEDLEAAVLQSAGETGPTGSDATRPAGPTPPGVHATGSSALPTGTSAAKRSDPGRQ